MTTPLLTTKLYIPPVRLELVLRPRLIERLKAGLHRKLALIAAPAGFGKTTLVSEWVQQSEQPVAWLSLDENDNDLLRFLTYLTAVLKRIDEDIAVDIHGALRASQSPPVEILLPMLVNEMAAVETDRAELGRSVIDQM